MNFVNSQRYPYDENNTDTGMLEHNKLYYHRVGEPQEKDVLVAEFPENPSWLMYVIYKKNDYTRQKT